MMEKRIYLARNLHLPTGEIRERYVVAVCNDVVVDCYSFEAETHSMLLVDDLYLKSGCNGGLIISEAIL